MLHADVRPCSLSNVLQMAFDISKTDIVDDQIVKSRNGRIIASGSSALYSSPLLQKPTNDVGSISYRAVYELNVAVLLLSRT